MIIINIQLMNIEDLIPAEYNPRKDLQSGDPEYEKLKKSILEFDYIDPIIWNERTSRVVGGHQRLKILSELDYKEVHVSVVDLDEEKEKVLNLALNKTGGEWDISKLKELLEELSECNIDLEITGFSEAEIEQIFLQAEDTEIETPVEEDDFDVQQALNEIDEPETKYGDIWKLGRHLLVCGDATKAEDVNLLMGDIKANLVITDPPYNVDVESDSEKLIADGRNTILNDDMLDEDFKGFLLQTFKRYSEIMDPKAAIYVFHPSLYQREFENAMNAAGVVVRTQCIWVKNNFTLTHAHYKFKHEPVFYAYLKGSSPAWYGDLKQNTIWKSGLPVENPEPQTIWEVSRGDVTKYVHPTQKPLELIAIPLRNSSKKKNVIADFFGGSGSTLMACEQMERECRMMELDPVFCDVIKKRFYESTGIEPVLINK